MKNLYTYKDRPVLVITENGEPLFKAQDIAKMLEYASTQKAMEILDDDEKLFNLSGYSGQHRKTWFVTESGFYHLVFKSSKPEARVFRKWVTSVVLPSIKKVLNATEPLVKHKQMADEALAKWDDMKAKIKVNRIELAEMEKEAQEFGDAFFGIYRADPHQLGLFDSETVNLTK